ncbi:hypothetical protein EAG_13661 [Camponotus floridanus]|uniref:Uncharacterized protein n=1 Tax=Camponotus floridanus TaxID=104421 RepID=E2A3Y4_CAMFO|nr:hypothetical protein EAG_13661 [Camponotus floridanus]
MSITINVQQQLILRERLCLNKIVNSMDETRLSIEWTAAQKNLWPRTFATISAIIVEQIVQITNQITKGIEEQVLEKLKCARRINGYTFSCGCAPHYTLRGRLRLAATFEIPAFVVAPHRLHCLLSNIGRKHRGGVEGHGAFVAGALPPRLVSEPLEACDVVAGRRIRTPGINSTRGGETAR